MGFLERLTRTIHRDWDDIPKARANFEITEYEDEEYPYDLTHRVEWAELAANGPAGEPLEPFHLFLAVKNYGPSPVLLYLNTWANDPNPAFEVNILPGHWVEFMDLDLWTQPRIRVDPLLYSQRSECEIVQMGWPCWEEEPQDWCDMWAVGHIYQDGAGTKHYPTMGTWANVINPITDDDHWLADVAGTSPADYWAVGYDMVEGDPWSGLLAHWNGLTWTEYPDQAPPFYGCWCFEPIFYWAVGGSVGQGEIWNYNGAIWGLHTAPTQETRIFRAVHGWAPTDTWAVGDDGMTYRYGGAVWANVACTAEIHFYGVWGLSANEAWACGGDNPWWNLHGGAGGQIWSWNGISWTRDAVPGTPPTFRAIWGFANDDIWVVGDSGSIFHWNGAVWASVAEPAGLNGNYDYRGVFGCWPDSLWAIGTNMIGGNVIIRWDGMVWTIDHGPNAFEMDLLGLKGVIVPI